MHAVLYGPRLFHRSNVLQPNQIGSTNQDTTCIGVLLNVQYTTINHETREEIGAV